MSDSKTVPRRLVPLATTQTPAPPDVRERLAIPASRLADATRTLLHQPGIREGLILSTCNRVELITWQEDTPAPDGNSGAIHPALPRFLHESFSVQPATLHPPPDHHPA